MSDLGIRRKDNGPAQKGVRVGASREQGRRGLTSLMALI